MSRRSTIAKRAVWLAVTAISIYLVIPSLIQTFSSWPELQRMRSGSLAMMIGLELLSLVCFWIFLGLCIRTSAWGLMAASQLASGAIARLAPGGAATATAVHYRMLHDGGIPKSQAASGLTVATVLNLAILFALPIFSVPAILSGTPIDSALVNGAIVASVSFVGAAIIGGLFMSWDKALVALGDVIDTIAGWFKREREQRRSVTFLESRDLIRQHLASNWYRVVLANFGKWAFDYLALVMAVRGVGHDDTSSVLLLAFITASVLGRIPFTPGGLGFVEAGLTGTLTLAGLSPGDAVLATLAYRLVSYWMPIPLGALAYFVHRRRMSRTGKDLPPLSSLPS